MDCLSYTHTKNKNPKHPIGPVDITHKIMSINKNKFISPPYLSIGHLIGHCDTVNKFSSEYGSNGSNGLSLTLL